ncbi:hypothetical protein KC357_g7895 [Hortaea werneckii]|nr:hypothetical protein KC357_g7895 [Hortaea werneckii]
MPGNFDEIPEDVAASWPDPNYDHPRNHRAWLPEFAIVFLAVSTILVAGRLYERGMKRAGGWGLDDVLISSGWLFSCGLSIVACIDGSWYGLGRHTWDVRREWYSGAALMGWLAQVLFLTSTCCTKCSVLLFYRRMVKDTGRWKYAIWTAIGLTAAYWAGFLLAYCLICRPLNAYWLSYNQGYDEPYQCIHGDVLTIFVGALSVISDKVALDIIFSLSIVVAGAGIARTYYLWKINRTFDTSWVGFDLFTWSLVECHLAIIFACAPSLRAFIRRYLGESLSRRFTSSLSNSRQTKSNTTPREGEERLAPSDNKCFALHEDTAAPKGSCFGVSIEHESDGSSRTDSSDAEAAIRNAEDYELYNIRQLNKHKRMRSNTSESISQYNADPKKRHDVDSAV